MFHFPGQVKTKIRKVPKASILMTTPTLYDNPVLDMGQRHDELCLSPGSLERKSTPSSGTQTKLEEKREGSVTRCLDVMDAEVESANDPFQDRDSFFVTQVTMIFLMFFFSIKNHFKVYYSARLGL